LRYVFYKPKSLPHFGKLMHSNEVVALFGRREPPRRYGWIIYTLQDRYLGRRLHLKQAMAAIRAYEYKLSRVLLEILEETPGLTLYGLRDVRRLEERVPTFSFTLQNQYPRPVAEKLGDAGIYVWDGNYYALAMTERLGLEESGGMVCVGAVHYNTLEEVSRLRDALVKIVDSQILGLSS